MQELSLAFFSYYLSITLPLGMVIMEHDRKHILTTLKKARGTLEKVIEMTEDDIYCADVAHQINAAM